MKQVIVFFDFERIFNADKHMENITCVLDEYDVKAAFNTCGIVVEKFPKVVRKLDKDGHEISSHGYMHEDFIQLEDTGDLGDVLEKTEKIVKKVTGKRPVGVRSPFYLWNFDVYSTFQDRGYKWASNSHIFRTELLDVSLLEYVPKKVIYGMKWVKHRKKPFERKGVLKVPLLSSDDGELIGDLSPLQKSPDERLDFAFKCLKKQFQKSGKFFNLNFHPYIIGSSNRIEVLDRILDYLHGEVEFILPRDNL